MRKGAQRLTAADRQRFAQVRSLGCLACYLWWLHARVDNQKAVRTFCGAVELHHPVSGNRRIGSLVIMPLGVWHHRGDPLPNRTASDMELLCGPSLARSSKQFHAVFGTDNELLDLTNAFLTGKTEIL